MFHARLRDGLELRLLEERHAPILFGLVDQERHYLRDWFAWVDATQTEDDILTFIRGARERFATKGDISTGIWVENQFAGCVGTHLTNSLNRRTEMGYWLARSFQGRGVMTESCGALVHHALTDLDLNRVEIRCVTSNVHSRGVAKRLGFTHEATLREAELLHGKYHDLEVWSMLRRELRG
jgi:ribosomal-protein-serine acetyltransferase